MIIYIGKLYIRNSHLYFQYDGSYRVGCLISGVRLGAGFQQRTPPRPKIFLFRTDKAKVRLLPTFAVRAPSGRDRKLKQSGVW